MTARFRVVRAVAAICLVITTTGAGMRGSAAGAANHAPGAPTDLLVDEAASPLWVTGPPTFGWIPHDVDRDEIQTAYRILVATEPTTEPKSDSILWDSGRVASSAESFVSASRLHLASDHRFWWTVQTWDRLGIAGAFARPVSFDTALDDVDWHADWIRRPTAPANPLEDYFLARRAFAVGSSPVVRAIASVSAGQQYELYVDGVRVGSGPSYAYPDEQYYQPTDITRYLEPGRTNVVAMIVHNLGAGQGRPAQPPGLIAHVTIEHRDGARQTITTDGSWRLHEGPWLPAPPRNEEGDFIETIDARKLPPAWAKVSFDDRGWEHAEVVGPPSTKPWTHLVAQRTQIVERALKPVTFKALANGTYVADFGAVIAATPSIMLSEGKAGRRLTLTRGFLLDANGHVSTTQGTQQTDMHDDYIERDGAQRLRLFGYLGFRYLEVAGAGETLTADDVTAYARHADVPDTAASSFSSSSPVLDRIWAMARHSALYGSQEQFVDTPTREKGQFLRDASNISSVTSVAFAERQLTWQALRDFARSQAKYWPDGRVNAVYPNGDGRRDIPDFTEDYVGWVLRYYELTGDRATLAALYPTISRVAGYVAHAISPQTGLVTNLPGGDGDYAGGIVDWPIAMRYGYDKSSVALTTVNILAIEVFRDVERAAQALRRPATEMDAQRARADSLVKAVNTRLRRSDGVYIDGLHQDGTQSTHASQQANAYALAAGIAPAPDRAAVVDAVVKLGMAMGPDVAGVLLAGLHASGNDQALVDIVSNAKIPGWAQILDRGATFTWESWNARDVPGDSESHAWGATVLPELMTEVLGVQVATPGASRVDVRPPHTSITNARGRLATERGPVSVAWHRKDARHFTLQLTVPDNVVATVHVPAAFERYVREGGHGLGSVRGVNVEAVGSGAVRLAVGSGHYSFAVAPHAAPNRTGLTLVIGFAIVVVLAGLVLFAEVRRRSAALPQ
ncbi:MAG: alpha-L-rhamnosidase [Actinomycetota bacterium]|nr:alpha-L-rhamnosidase [Actinomycetota bacterium]